MSLLDIKLLREYRKSLSQYLPNGLAWISKNVSDDNLYKLIQGLSPLLLRTDITINTIIDEHNIATTNDFIIEWEKALGIPDDCISTDFSLERRRNNIITKLNMSAVSTEKDFVTLASIFGIQNINIFSAIDDPSNSVFPIVFPATFTGTEKEARFTMIVELPVDQQPNVFPYTFPITFTEQSTNLIECLFNKLKPSNTLIQYRYVL